MAHAAPDYEERQEFWKPSVANGPAGEADQKAHHPPCQSCGADFVPDSRYCHVCGKRLGSVAADRHVPAALRLLSHFAYLRDALGQTNASLAALLAGCSCLVAAVVISFVFNATTLLDWQAVQLWRIEWLLAAIALSVAGILLKKKSQ